MQLLYSNHSEIGASVSKDPYGLVISNEVDDYDLIETKTTPLQIMVPEGYRDVLSLSTERPARMCFGTKKNCKTAYKVEVVTMATKVPGFFFTGYQTAQFFGQQAISEVQYRELLEDFFETHPGSRENFQDIIQGYNFTNDIPKYKLFVKLSPDITQSRREQIADGIRANFRDERTILLDFKESMAAIDTSILVFQIFVGIIGVIALTIAFFLLLVSTTQNVRENVWEYGCLRAMGFTKKQGIRTFMYEQYTVVISSLFLGSLVGVVVASVVTAQFFLFLEFKFDLQFPTELWLTMVVMALVTTFYAVWTPVKEVNKQKVATTLKGLA